MPAGGHGLGFAAGQLDQLELDLADRPELLTGAGAEAPIPSVLRFSVRHLVDSSEVAALP